MSRSRRPGPKVSIWSIQDRRAIAAGGSPWVVRWRVGTRQFSRAFKVKAQAQRFHASLLLAVDDGAQFDTATGEPMSWSSSALTVAELARDFLCSDRWSSWAPRTRKGHVEALTRWVQTLVKPAAPPMPPDLSAVLGDWLRPDRSGDHRQLERWLNRWSLPVAELTKVDVARAVAALGMKLDGTPAGASTASRLRRTARVHINHAIAMGVLPDDLWPKAPPRTKKSRSGTTINAKDLPTAAQVAVALDAMINHRQESHGYRLLTACVYYAGLRPSEARALSVEDFDLPADGWGSVEVHAAVQDEGNTWGSADEQIGTTKTATDRVVPIPPKLVDLVREYIGDRTTGLLVVTRRGNPVTYSNWTRAWIRARKQAGGRWTLYDLRHANATTLLNAGLNLREAASRLGHSVETLTKYYVGRNQDDTSRGNALIDAAVDW